ncbi:shikimate-5-dehydrogenase [Acephala macrosclerotiorum]|nr:shikimate-5-dehydrogenase [Acephala macrosclerotiorum]
MADEKPKINESDNSGLPQRRFYIFGHNISHSLSPALHNAGFKHLSLPYHYTIHQSPSVDASVEAILSSPDFGGASVTYPHKLQIRKLLHSISPRAEKIGAVNTVIVKDTEAGTKLLGDNTDWEGIKACILKSGVEGLEGSRALVLGAGGAARAACFALQQIGILDVVIVNRTRSKAEGMAADFPDLKFEVFESLEELSGSGRTGIKVVIACVPADDLGEEKIPHSLFSVVPSGVLVEMAYRPPKTGMMEVAEQNPGWKIFKGTDVLEEQAYAQSTLWTGKPAPVSVMKDSMVAAINARL